MARLSRFVAVAVLLGGATVSLSACTGGSDPVASPSPSVSTVVTPTPSASPSPTPLTDPELLALIPEDARAENFVSASNFAKFYIIEYQRMFDQRDTRLFAFLAGDKCGFCENGIQTFQDVIGTGGSTRGGEITVQEDLAAGGLEDSGNWNASFDISIGALEYLDASGSVTKSIPASKGRVGVLLSYEGSHWKVVEVAGAEN